MSLFQIFAAAFANPTEGPLDLAAATLFGLFWPAIIVIDVLINVFFAP